MERKTRMQTSWKLAGGLIGGLALSVPVALSNAIAAPSAALNPCPGIYYEEPYNSSRLVPAGCQPNAFTQAVNAGTTSNLPTIQGTSGAQLNRIGPAATTAPAQSPLPETLQNAIATVLPTNGTVDVMLRNTTNTPITYEVIGHTQQRTLAGGQEVLLQDLPVPVTVTTVRPDKGLVEIQPITSPTAGMIGFSLDESTRLDGDQGAIRIQQDGQVFLN